MEYVAKRASILLLAAALSAACRHGGNPGPPEPRTDTRLRVENQNFQDMNVYVLAGSQRIRLGTVTGLSTQVLTIPPDLVRGSLLRFEVHPIGGEAGYLANPQAGAVQELDDRPVPKPDRIGIGRRRGQLFGIGGFQDAGEARGLGRM